MKLKSDYIQESKDWKTGHAAPDELDPKLPQPARSRTRSRTRPRRRGTNFEWPLLRRSALRSIRKWGL